MSGTSFSPGKQRRREGCLSLAMWMKEIIRGVLGCFMGRRQPRILGEEYGGAVIVFSGRGETVCLNPGSKRCESGGAGIFTAGLCADGGITGNVCVSLV